MLAKFVSGTLTYSALLMHGICDVTSSWTPFICRVSSAGSGSAPPSLSPSLTLSLSLSRSVSVPLYVSHAASTACLVPLSTFLTNCPKLKNKGLYRGYIPTAKLLHSPNVCSSKACVPMFPSFFAVATPYLCFDMCARRLGCGGSRSISPRASRVARPERIWVAVKELNLSYYVGETILCYIYPFW